MHQPQNVLLTIKVIPHLHNLHTQSTTPSTIPLIPTKVPKPPISIQHPLRQIRSWTNPYKLQHQTRTLLEIQPQSIHQIQLRTPTKIQPTTMYAHKQPLPNPLKTTKDIYREILSARACILLIVTYKAL